MNPTSGSPPLYHMAESMIYAESGVHIPGPRRSRRSLSQHGLSEDEFDDVTEPGRTAIDSCPAPVETFIMSVSVVA